MADTPTDPNKDQAQPGPEGTNPPTGSPAGAGATNEPSPPPPSNVTPQPPNPSPPPPSVGGEAKPLPPTSGLDPTDPASSTPKAEAKQEAPGPASDAPAPDPPAPNPLPTASDDPPASGPEAKDPVATPSPPSAEPTAPQSPTVPEPNLAGPSESARAEPGSASPSPEPSLRAEEVGPPWMRTDPSVRESQDSQGLADGTPNLSPPTESPAPWQSPSQNLGVEATNVEDEQTEGHFPVVIFVILVLGIIVAVGVFLFTQGAFPLGG